MTCSYTFPNGDVVRGKPALKAYLVQNLASLLPERAEASPAFKRTAIQEAIRPRFSPEAIARANAAVQRVVDSASAGWENGPKVVVVFDMNDPIIPERVRLEDQRQRSGGAFGETEGFFYQGTAYLISSRLKTPRDAARVLFHEVLGHYGLRGAFGQALKSKLEQIVALRKKDVLDKARQYGLDQKNPAHLLVAAEEVLAVMAQNTPGIGFVRRAVAAIRTWVRQHIPGLASLELTDDEIIRNFILPARAYVERSTKDEMDMGGAAFSRAEPAQEDAGLTPPPQGFLRRVQASIQDNFNRVRQVQERIAKLTGAPVPEYANYYGAETQRPGRIAARLEDFEKQMTGPLMEKLAKSGHTMEQLSELLHAMHAKERNEAVAKINDDMPDGGSGMTNDEAAAILEKNSRNRELHKLADEARAIARATLEMKRAYGLIDQESFDRLATRYEYYVPLKGDGEYGPKIKRAMGHDKREEFILQNIARDFQQAVVVGEKNLARQALLQMALENADSDLWTVGVLPKGRYVAGQAFDVVKNGEVVASFDSAQQAQAWVDGRTDSPSNYIIQTVKQKFVVERDGKPVADFKSYSQAEAYVDSIKDPVGKLKIVDAGEKVREFIKPLQDNEVPVYVDGQMTRIQIKDEALARQLRRLDAGQMHPILEIMRGVNRYLSKIYTGYNPAFIIRNTARDAMTGTINMLGNEGGVTAAKAWASYPKAMAALMSYAATGRVPDTDAGKVLQEYRQHGGKTGASWMSDLEAQGKTLQRLFDDAYGATGYLKDKKPGKAALIAGRKIVGGMAHVVEVMNTATENGLRLALYMAMRDQGKTPGESAQAAKSVTVDFDRKGAITPALGAIYLFFNPAIQGTANAIKTLAKGPKKAQAWAALGTLAALGFYLGASGMDDDPDRWLGESWESRSKNMMIKAGTSTVKVPVSQEFAPFYAFGVAMAEARRDGKGKMAAAGRIVSSFLDSYFPLQGAFNPESDNHPMDLAMAMTPTALKPSMQIAANRNTFGSQVVPENELTKDRPDNLKMARGTKGSPYDVAAQGMAAVGEAMGAGKYENDITKVSPETLKLLWRTYTGGLGQFITDSAGLANIGAQGGGAEASDVPLVKDFLKPNDVKAIRGRYYDLVKEARAAAEEFKQAKKAGDGEEADKILSQPGKADLVGLDDMIKRTNKAAAAIRDEMVDVNADKTLGLAEKRAKLKALEKEEEALYRDAIAAFK